MGSVDVGVLLDQRYRVVERRASGASATVWEAEDEFLRRRVAIKILHDHLATDPDLLGRFANEARAAATVNHPALVAVYDSITDQPGIVLEWVDGPDLRQRLDAGAVPPVEITALGATLCDGLAALHDHGLIHRDIKPANILLTSTGQPKLTDFGIATAHAGDRTATGIVLGTAKYLAPEQVRGSDLDGRCDVFALAAVLYEALSGRAPWVRDGDLPTALARLEEDPIALQAIQPHLSSDLTSVVMRGLAREPDARWPSAAAFGEALRAAAALPPPPSPAVVAEPASDRGPIPVSTDATTIHEFPSPGGHRPVVRSRRRIWPRLVGFGVMVAIALLGWTLVTAVSDLDWPLRIGVTAEPDTSEGVRIVRADAFDPEGTGPAGEHNNRALLAIDGDPATAWPTESYDARDLGAKSGVGLILLLDAVIDLSAIAILTEGADDWAVELYIANGVSVRTATQIEDFGEVRGVGSDLSETAEISLSGRGDTVVIWLTDLGSGGLPVRLSIAEVTIR